MVYDCSAGGSKTKTFYTVQSSDDATRLLNGGTPWPTEANRSNLGEGVYAWSTKEDALNYYNLIKQRNDDVEILEFEINVSDLDNMSALDLTRLTDDEVNLFLDSHAKLNGQTPSHGYDYIQRNTGMGVENFFSGKVFSSIKFKK